MSLLLGNAYQATYAGIGVSLTGATVTLAVTAPDGTSTTNPVTPTGNSATATVQLTEVGTWLLVWTVWSAGGTAIDVEQDQVSCIAPAPDLISISDLRDELNLSPTDTTKTVKLRRWLKAATTVVENITGPIRTGTRTDVFDGQREFVVLPNRWVQSLTLVQETRGITNYVLTEQPLGQSVNAFGYTWDRTINRIVRRSYGGAVGVFPPGKDVIRVDQVLGMTTIPDDIQKATAALIKHWYRKDEVAGRGAWQALQDEPIGGELMVGNYLVPNEVIELLNPWRRKPGVF